MNESLPSSTSLEFFEYLRSYLTLQKQPIRILKSRLRNLLNLVCDDELRDSNENFGSLFFRIDFICRKHVIVGEDKFNIQFVRKQTGRNAKPDNSSLLECAKILADFYCRLHKLEIPNDICAQLPQSISRRELKKIKSSQWNCIRCIVDAVDASCCSVNLTSVEDTTLYKLDLSSNEISYLTKMVHEGTILNLLNVSVENNTLNPSYIVYEPDFLLDISSIAQCFTEYGHHPLSFIANKLKRKPLSQPILLGNFAGSALDDIIHTVENEKYNVNDSIRSNFKEKVIDFCTCPSFEPNSFVTNAKDQASNLEQAVTSLFSTFNKDLAILEPTFICEALGIQGRVDLMTIDANLLVEQKSGKNGKLEWQKGTSGRMMPDNHYIQLLLYLGIMMFNFNKSPKEVNAKLLYSRYAPNLGLVNVGFEQHTFLEVLEVRNKIVATESMVAKNGFVKILDYLTPSVLNEKHLNSDFYTRYLLPQLIEVTSPLQSMSAIERAYFCSYATFAYKELLISKLGRGEGGHGCVADLWNLSTDKKKETGDIYYGLKIISKQQSSTFNGFDTIKLQIPEQEDDFLPNFRAGDMIFLYSYPDDKEPDIRKSLLFSGYLVSIDDDTLTVRLGDGQKNPDLIDYYSKTFAIEHAYSDASSNAELRGLLEFATCPAARKEILLALREPTKTESLKLSRSYDSALDELLLKIKQANDYFLLVGPPGTGKTHRAIKFILQEELQQQDSNILLLSYTNRAVDELCSMLTEDLGVEFIRLGRSYSCDSRYKRYLLNSVLESESAKLNVLKSKISGTRIFISTVSYLLSRPNIFSMKQFSLAIIDEASQILEPDLIGILCSHMKSKERCDIDKFVMVGDYKQLPAVVQQTPKESAISDESLTNLGFENCRMSLFQRLIYLEKNKKRDAFNGMLKKQGRMHPEIAEFPNRMFYANDKLEIVPCDHQLEERLNYNVVDANDKLEQYLRDNRLLFFSSPKNTDTFLSDKANFYEARLVADMAVRLALMMGPDFNEKESIGIIVPYRNQIALIRKEIAAKLKSIDFAPNLSNIAIDTVERFQGSQRDVIIYSFTVQYLYQIDFLTSNNFVESFDNGAHLIDPKLNVVMTRARKQLIMVGNDEILKSNSIYNSMIEFIKEHGLFIKDNVLTS